MEPSCTKGGEDPCRREAGTPSATSTSPVTHGTPRACRRCGRTHTHTHPSVTCPTSPGCSLPKSPCQQLYFKLLEDAQAASRLLRAPPALQISCFPPGWWAGSADILGQARGAEAGEQMSGDNEALTSPNPLPALEAAQDEGRKGSAASIALIMPEIAA